jgi:hypothetical protein
MEPIDGIYPPERERTRPLTERESAAVEAAATRGAKAAADLDGRLYRRLVEQARLRGDAGLGRLDDATRARLLAAMADHV